MITDPWFYVLAFPCIMLLGLAKGGFGTGWGSVVVPILAILVPVPQAAAIVLPILCAMDLIGVWSYRKQWDRAAMPILLPGAALGIAAGTLSFRYLDEHMIRLMIGMIGVGFSLNHWFGRRRPEPAGRSVVKGGFWSAVSALTSFVAHAGGPPLAVYLLPQRMDKSLYVGTTVIFFLVVNYAKIVPYIWLGVFSRENLLTSLALLPLAPLGMALGIWLHRNISGESFYRLTYVFLFLAGLKLLYDGGMPLLRALA